MASAPHRMLPANLGGPSYPSDTVSPQPRERLFFNELAERPSPGPLCKGPRSMSSMRPRNGAAASAASAIDHWPPSTNPLSSWSSAHRSLREPKTGPGRLCAAQDEHEECRDDVVGDRGDEDAGADGSRCVSGCRSARNSRSRRDFTRLQASLLEIGDGRSGLTLAHHWHVQAPAPVDGQLYDDVLSF